MTALEKFDLLVEVMPQVEEAAIYALAGADPAVLKENRQFYIMVPIPKVLMEECVSDTITLEDAKARLSPTLGFWLKTVEQSSDQTVVNDNGEVVFDAEGQGMVMFRFVFEISHSLFENF